MTTIAANQHGMASDSMAVDMGTRSRVTKIFRVKGDLIGICGDYLQGRLFVDWYGDRRRRVPDLDGEFEALVLTKKGKLVVWTGEMVPCEMQEVFWAIGSGRDAALAVMHMDEPPVVAIEIACKIDAMTDFPVQSMNLEQ